MGGQILIMALLALLACLLIAAAFTDLKTRIISNSLNLAIACLAPVFWWANGLSIWPDMALQLALGLSAFAVFAALFATGLMGGGDVKLIAALALWFPWQMLLAIIVLMAVIGGAVTIITVVHHRMTRRIGQPEIPYGVAISLAALWVVGERYLNHFA